MGITLSQLRHFAAVADELSFTRAAAELGIGQQTLSSSIRALERDAGVRLFERSTRRVALTPEGAALLEPARRALAELDAGFGAVRELADGRAGRLRVGATVSGDFRLVSRVLATLEAERPHVTVEVSRAATAVNVERLRAGELDAALVRPPLYGDGVTVVPLLADPLVVVVPDDDPLAGAQAVRPCDCAGRSFVIFPRAANPGLHDSILGWLGEHRAALAAIVERPDEEMMIREVAAGGGITMATRPRAEEISAPGTAWRELEPPHTGELALAHRAGDPNPLLGPLVAAFRLAARAIERRRP